MSGGGGTTQTIQNADPWSGAQPYLKDIMTQGQALYRSGVGQDYFPGSTVVPFAPQSEIALGALENRALTGSPITAGAQGLLSDTLSGNYLDPTQNPAYQTMASDITDRVNSAVGLARRAGSPAHAEAIARGISEGGSNLYNEERQRQVQGLLMAPQLEGMDLADIQRMAQVGGMREAKAGEGTQEAFNRFMFEQQAPWNALQDYSGAVSGFGGLGGTSSSSTNDGSGGFSTGGLLGGAATGAGLAAGLGPSGLGLLGASSPWAWPIIGGGALLGAFG